MRVLIAIGLVAWLVGACGGAPAEEKTDTATGTSTDTEDEDSTDGAGADGDEFKWPNRDELLKEGHGTKVLRDLAFKRGAAAIRLTHTDGESNFIVVMFDKNGERVQGLANEIGPAIVEQAVAIPEDGDYYLEIEADGDWKIESLRPKTLDAMPTKLEGKSWMVSGVFPMKKGNPATLSLKHSGSSNFIVRAVDAKTGDLGDLIVNEIGEWQGEALFSVDNDGHYLFEIQGDTDWSITAK